MEKDIRVSADFIKKLLPYLASTDTGQFVVGLIEDEMARQRDDGRLRAVVTAALWAWLFGILIGASLVSLVL